MWLKVTYANGVYMWRGPYINGADLDAAIKQYKVLNSIVETFEKRES